MFYMRINSTTYLSLINGYEGLDTTLTQEIALSLSVAALKSSSIDVFTMSGSHYGISIWG